MLRIKFSCSDVTVARDDHFNPLIAKFLPKGQNKWKNCEFFFNDAAITKADYWVIVGDVDLDEEYCEVNPNNVILMTGEPQSIKRYDDFPEFINQFGRVFTSHHDLKHSQVSPCRPPINWWIDGGSPIKSREEFQKWKGEGLGYDDFKDLKEMKKEKLLSVFCSDKVFTQGHKMRFNFCKHLKKHFKDQVDWFGNGVQPIDNKWDGVAPYKYHIALENFNSPDYWTEKLMDPLMVLTYPIYCGATNVNNYFPNDKVFTIDIKYPRTAIAKIKRLIDENAYEKSSEKLLRMRDLVMDEYNAFNLAYKIAESDNELGMVDNNKQLVKIKKEKLFILQTSSPVTQSRRNMAQRIERSFNKKIDKIKIFLVDYFLLIKFKIG